MPSRLVVCWWLGLSLLAGAAHGYTLPTGFRVDTLATGLATPCAFDFLPADRVLYTEQNTGRVRLYRAGTGVQSTPVVQVAGVVTGGERGLLGLALDPEFPLKPYLYLFHSAAGGRSAIVRVTLTGDLDGTGGGDLLELSGARMNLMTTIPDNAPNHNGGTLRFGADGTLIASLGDDAFPCGAQDSTGLRGVLLRLRTSALPVGVANASIAALTPPDNPYATSPDSNARLVLARGLRNPFRVQTDVNSGVLVIGDVGESMREELDLLLLPGRVTTLPGIAVPGANFGWPYREGSVVGSHAGECPPTPGGLAAPAHDYDRTAQQGGASIIPFGFYWSLSDVGAFDWGAAFSGNLLFTDYLGGALVRLVPSTRGTGSPWVPAPLVPGQPNSAHFGEGFTEISDGRQGPDGALWFVRQAHGFAANTGLLARIVPAVQNPDPRPVAPLSMRLFASPAVGSATLLLESGFSAPASVTLHDASGRVLRRIADPEFRRTTSGVGVFWDGHDDDGVAVRPGIYWARLESGGRTASVRVPLLR